MTSISPFKYNSFKFDNCEIFDGTVPIRPLDVIVKYCNGMEDEMVFKNASEMVEVTITAQGSE